MMEIKLRSVPYIEEYYGGTSAGWTTINTQLADVDGSYGENDSGIFFFTPDGKYVEWTGIYLYCTIMRAARRADRWGPRKAERLCEERTSIGVSELWPQAEAKDTEIARTKLCGVGT